MIPELTDLIKLGETFGSRSAQYGKNDDVLEMGKYNYNIQAPLELLAKGDC